VADHQQPSRPIPLWMLTCPAIGDGSLRVWSLLARDERAARSPSIARLAKDLGRSKVTIRRALTELEGAGAIAVEPVSGRPNRYRLADESGPINAPAPARRNRERQRAQGRTGGALSAAARDGRDPFTGSRGVPVRERDPFTTLRGVTPRELQEGSRPRFGAQNGPTPSQDREGKEVSGAQVVVDAAAEAPEERRSQRGGAA
jgi:DNA-binding transcriptional ArsR family regulator